MLISEIFSEDLIITSECSSTSFISTDTLSTISLKLFSSVPNSFFFLIGILCVRSPEATLFITPLIFLISFVNVIVTRIAIIIPIINETTPVLTVAVVIFETTEAVSLSLTKPTSVHPVTSSFVAITSTFSPLIFSEKILMPYSFSLPL